MLLLDTMNYEDQFYIAERRIYFPLFKGKPFRGQKGKHFFSGFAAFDRAIIEGNFPSLQVGSDLRYFVCDDYACPVGTMYKRQYAFLDHAGVHFPNTARNQNGFVFYDDAEELLEKIKIYFEAARTKTKRKSHQSSVRQIYHRPCPTTKAMNERSLNDGLKERAKRKSELSDLALEVYEEPVV